MTKTAAQKAASQELAKREQARRSFMHFVRRTFNNFDEGWHHRVLCARLQQFSDDVIAGKSPRLLIAMPPRHTKSTIVSERFPVWHMSRTEDHEVVCACSAASLANDMSKGARRIAQESAVFMPQLTLLSEAVEKWRVRGGGSYKAVGIDSLFLGSGAHVLVIDDPFKAPGGIVSDVEIVKVIRWYRDTAYNRLSPGGGVLLMHQRLRDDDLAGFVLSEQEKGGDKWDTLILPAIAEEDDEYRKKGDPLQPSRFSAQKLAQIKAVTTPDQWEAKYQQRPNPEGGGIWKVAWFRTYLADPGGGQIVMTIDTASKASESNDPSAIQVWRHLPDRKIDGSDSFLLFAWAERLETPELKRMIRSLARTWKPHIVLIEDKSSGEVLIQQYRDEDDWKWPIEAVLPTRDKETRARVEAPAIYAGRCAVPEYAVWLPAFLDAVRKFPAKPRDPVDATSQYLKYIRSGGDTSRRLRALYG